MDRSIQRCTGSNAKAGIAAKWESAGKDLKREFKYYRLTATGKKQLLAEESKWKQLTGAIARIMWPAEEG
jgi:PadR family transcriptional regulator, regulatory protein PadR